MYEELRSKMKDFLVFRGFKERNSSGIFYLAIERRKMKMDFRKRNCKIWKDNVKVLSIPLKDIEKDYPKFVRYVNASIDIMHEYKFD